MNLYTDIEDIIEGSFSIEPMFSDIKTTVHYDYSYYHNFYINRITRESSEAQIAYGSDISEEVKNKWVYNDATMADVADRDIYVKKTTQTVIRFSCPLHALRDDIGSEIQISHHTHPSIKTATIVGMSLDFDSLEVYIEAIIYPKVVSIYASSNDGNIYKDDYTSWESCVGATTGDGVDTTSTELLVSTQYLSASPVWGITRFFMDFDLTDVSWDIESASVFITVESPTVITISLASGTQSTPLVADDFDEVGETSFGTASFEADAYERSEIIINQSGIDYLNANKGSVVKLCIREHNYDLSNVEPLEDIDLRTVIYTSSKIGEDMQPKITIRGQAV